MKQIKKILIILAVLILGFIIGLNINKQSQTAITQLQVLPKPEVTGGERGTLGIDKNINESTIDNYLGQKDAVYMDMRMLKDPGNYEAIGGDSYLSGFIKGFEVLPLPYIIPITNLPESVGKTYEGKTLFRLDKNNNYVANYEESLDILEYYFPKDKYIFSNVWWWRLCWHDQKPFNIIRLG